MSLRGTDVAAMMTRVEVTLEAAGSGPKGPAGVLPVAPEGDAEVNVAVLRKSADIRLDFPPGSARPVVGPVVRLGKRTLRRAVRWYVSPMMEQQSRFNHALLDGIERLRVRIERSPSTPASTRGAVAGTLPDFGMGRAVAVGAGAPALVDLLADDTDARPRSLLGDPIEGLTGLDPGSVSLILCDVTGLGPAPVISVLNAAHAALAPAATIVVGASDEAASLRLASLAWALSATGFGDVVEAGLPATGDGSGGLGEQLARVDAVARAAGSLLVARRGR